MLCYVTPKEHLGLPDKDDVKDGINWGRDLPEPETIADIRNVVAGDRAQDQGPAGEREEEQGRARQNDEQDGGCVQEPGGEHHIPLNSERSAVQALTEPAPSCSPMAPLSARARAGN